VKIVVLPRDPNPYQQLLYSELARLGVQSRYVGVLTPSHTLNLLLLPVELAACRLRGWSLIHVHWVFGFALPGASRLPWLRRISQAWFVLVLVVARLLRMRIVWTAHNTLPHERVFHDDAAARRMLVRSSEVVFVHSPAALTELAAIGARPRRSVSVPFGPFAEVDGIRPAGGGPDGSLRTLLFFGKVLDYKGVEDLLEVVATLPDELALRVIVAGECPDRALRVRLEALASERVQLLLEYVPDAEVSALFEAADAVVLPFRRVTTSASAALAFAHGRAVILPQVESFADLPDAAVLRYDSSPDGLRNAIIAVAQADAAVFARAAAAAHAHVARHTWADAARTTLAALDVWRGRT
jgi:glycosyltransferase involved in cell wall biosynthesis